MPTFIDLTGQQFGRLAVVSFAGNRHWNCACVCGATAVVMANNLKQGKSTSCGCFRAEVTKQRATKHGHTAGLGTTPEYRAWQSMLKRCYLKSGKRYANYAGRGISVCAEWRESFEVFLAHVGQRPSPKHSLDRIDNDRNYEPGNVRWATASRQTRNQTRNRLYDFRGQLLCLSDLSEIAGLKVSTMQMRLRLGWDVEAAVVTPLRKLG